MNHLLLLPLALTGTLVVGACLSDSSGGTGGSSAWEQVEVPTEMSLTDVHFPTASTGYAASTDGEVLKSTDGGDTWTTVLQTISSFSGIHFVNENTGWVVGGFNFHKTIDGGQTWTPQDPGVLHLLQAVHFANPNTGWVVGQSGKILKTTNAGETWSPQNSGTGRMLLEVQFLTPTLGFVAGDSGLILKTIDGGASWTPLTTGTTDQMNGIFFVDSLTGWAVGGGTFSGGTIIKTTDGGASWLPQPSGSDYFLYDVKFNDHQRGYAVGSTGRYLKTTNGGASWNIAISETFRPLNAIDFAGNAGIIVGDWGTLLKSRSAF